MKRLKAVKEQINLLNGWWTSQGLSVVYEFEGPRDERGNVVVRPREEAEYPENQISYWVGTCHEIDQMIIRLTALSAYCMNEAEKTLEAQK